jgi:hypothetical protein
MQQIAYSNAGLSRRITSDGARQTGPSTAIVIGQISAPIDPGWVPVNLPQEWRQIGRWFDPVVDMPSRVTVGPVEHPSRGLGVVSEPRNRGTRPWLAFHPGLLGDAPLNQRDCVAAEFVLEAKPTSGDTGIAPLAENIQVSCGAQAGEFR